MRIQDVKLGTCRYCGEGIYHGEEVIHVGDGAFLHVECFDSLTAREAHKLFGMEIREADYYEVRDAYVRRAYSD